MLLITGDGSGGVGAGVGVVDTSSGIAKSGGVYVFARYTPVAPRIKEIMSEGIIIFMDLKLE